MTALKKRSHAQKDFHPLVRGEPAPKNAKSRAKRLTTTAGGRKYEGGTALDRINDAMMPTADGALQWLHLTKGYRVLSVKSARAAAVTEAIKNGQMSADLYTVRKALREGF